MIDENMPRDSPLRDEYFMLFKRCGLVYRLMLRINLEIRA
jgi:hypothetical protein